MSRRVMVAIARPSIPVAPAALTWDPTTIDSGMSLSSGNLRATRTVIGGVGRAFSTWVSGSHLGPTAGVYYWETTPFWTGSTPSMLLGIAKSGVGTMLAGAALNLSGDVQGASIGAGQFSPVSGRVYRHILDLNDGTYRIRADVFELSLRAVDGGAIWQQNLFNMFRAGETKPAVSIGRIAGSTAAYVDVNFGQLPFAFPLPAGAVPIMETPHQFNPTVIGFSSAPFGTDDKSDPASLACHARIAGDVEVTRAGSCWVWGGQTESRRGSIELVNVDGGLDHMARYRWRDAPVEIWQGVEGQTLDQMTLWARAIAEDLVFDGRGTRRASLVLADPLAVYDAPIQPLTYPDTHPVTAEIGKPVPIVFGIPFGVTGVRQSPLTIGSDAFAWQIHDGGAPILASLGTVFDNGVDITSRCVWWPSALDRRGFRVNTGPMPAGRVSCNASGVSTTTLQTIVTNAAARLPVGRMTPLTIELPASGIDGIGSWAGIYIREPKTIVDVIREAMDSVCGWACPTRDGAKLRLGRVIDPQGRTPVLTLDRTNVLGEIQVEVDKARGLTTRLAGRRNWSPHSHSEIATSISDPLSPGYDANRVADLTADWRAIREGTPVVAGSTPLSDAYAQARSAEFRGTLLQESAHIKAEANRVCTMWYPTRHFIRLTARLGAVAADALEPGDIVTLRWPRFGLDNPKPVHFMVVSVRSRFWSRRVELTLWGSLPLGV